ncbi:MAG: CBS domain-containing protein [Erysipelotrichaceae bacterium]|nr:CBS domain-containing protein [Erysipelotrichaceae bacterium]MBQ9986800.1 CBS domain-containing protein [Erysipelotrichales bacterium]MBR3693347.1 CBS domain-containing protein [Erysipelotrichales bacterium]
MYVKNYMSCNVVTVDRDATISEAVTIMNETNIHRLPVMHNGKLVGLITDGNIEKASPSKATSLSMYEINYLLSKTTVKDCMTKNVHTIEQDELLEIAADKMRHLQVTCLPVMDGDKLVGIITEVDLFNAFLDLLGTHRKGARVTIEIEEDKVGVMRDICTVMAQNNVSISHIAIYHMDVVSVVLRVDCGDEAKLRDILTSAGYKVSHILIIE